MINKPANFIREREGYYWVLAEYESKSSPGKMYEVRTSKRDGKTYCTCRGWVAALNRQRFGGVKGEAVCCHIEEYRRSGKATEPIIIMDFEDFVHVKRGIALGVSKEIPTDVKVRRA